MGRKASAILPIMSRTFSNPSSSSSEREGLTCLGIPFEAPVGVSLEWHQLVIVHDRLYERSSLPTLAPDPVTQLEIATARAELATEVLRAEILRYEIMLKKGASAWWPPFLSR